MVIYNAYPVLFYLSPQRLTHSILIYPTVSPSLSRIILMRQLSPNQAPILELSATDRHTILSRFLGKAHELIDSQLTTPTSSPQLSVRVLDRSPHKARSPVSSTRLYATSVCGKEDSDGDKG